MVKMPTCSGQEMSPTCVRPTRLSLARTSGLGENSMWSTPKRLRFSMLARPSGERSQVDEVTHSGFRPSCSMRTTW